MTVQRKNIESPDEHRSLPNGSAKASIVSVDGMTISRGHVQPGWRWSNDMKPMMGTASCEFAHTGFMLAGVLHIEMDDGASVDLQPGDVYSIPAGHDAWVVGDEPVHTIDWSDDNVDFGKPPAS